MPADTVAAAQVYAAESVDRAAHRRKDAAWLAAARATARSRVVLLSELRVPMLGSEEEPLLHAPSVAELGVPLPSDSFFLGERDGVAWFALDIGADVPPHGRLVELRSVALLLSADDAALLAYARGLAHWHRGHRFCGRCGAPTELIQGGHARQCSVCGTETFPRTDPAVIVLVTHDEQALLARSSRFPLGMYSALAGFVEAGESLEQTLRREVREEVGVEIENAVYRASQPWPFPQSLMLGFRATARDTVLSIDHDEIEDAVWIGRSELADPARCPVRLPNRDSIARFLIEEWLAEGD